MSFLTLFLPTTASAQNVTLTDNGTTVTLANGLALATIEKASAKITTFKVGSSPNLAGSKGFYYTTHVVSGGTDAWVGMGGSTYSVVTNTAQMVDISIRNPKMGYDATAFPNGMFDVDKHFVMRSGISGIYTYLVWKHMANQPEATLYQQRTSEINTGLSGTVYCYSDKDTWNVSPGDALSSGNLITDSTFELPPTTSYTYPTDQNYQANWPIYYTPNPAGMIGMNHNLNPVWTKYDWAVYSGPTTSSLNTFGVANEQNGVWVLNGSQEYLNGGPTKLRGGVQASSIGMNTNETHGLGDGPDQYVAAGATWEKIYGPYLIYGNAGTSHTALWQDAQAKGAAEVAAWPYSWLPVSESIYPRNRGTIQGTLKVPGQSTANAQIIVCDAGLDWKFQGNLNYIYWTKADANGNFTVPKLRPHTYSIYAYVPGILGDWQMDNVVVSAGGTTNLGTVVWNPPMQGQRIFRVGTPDRSTGEFRYGNLPRQFGLWFRYLDEVGTNQVNYTVGTSKPADNWFYAQPVVAAADGTFVAPTWNIKFNLTKVPTDPATLTVALAGAAGSGAFNVLVNGTDISPDAYHGIYTTDDTALYRDGVKAGQYQTYQLSFSASLLKVGANTVTIKVRKTGSGTWTGTRPVLPAYGLMYDCVQLEAGPQVTSLDLSTGQSATASSAMTTNQVYKGNDGSTANRWCASVSTFPQWWRVDLGEQRTLRSMVINWYKNTTLSYKYKIEVSNDDVNYTTVVDKTGNTELGISYDSLPSDEKYRYVRATVTGGSAGAVASFYECQVFGN